MFFEYQTIKDVGKGEKADKQYLVNLDLESFPYVYDNHRGKVEMHNGDTNQHNGESQLDTKKLNKKNKLLMSHNSKDLLERSNHRKCVLLMNMLCLPMQGNPSITKKPLVVNIRRNG